MDPHGGMQIRIQEVKSRNKPNPNVKTGRANERENSPNDCIAIYNVCIAIYNVCVA